MEERCSYCIVFSPYLTLDVGHLCFSPLLLRMLDLQEMRIPSVVATASLEHEHDK